MGIELNHSLCTHCGTCVEVCPEDILQMVESRVTVRYPQECGWCGACQMDCPTGAIQVVYGPEVGPAFLPRSKGEENHAV